ncbi:MAG: phage holin family protein, partial [Oscillospiraceae bacterium]|nr:phage holin family protein [Oscillospiraceae bacterium]
MEIRAAVTAVIAFGTALFGWVGWAVVIWVVAMLLDYLTGTAAAVSKGKWSGSAARSGLWHKLGSIAAVCVAALCDIALG